jgi:cytochrome c5
MSSYPYGSDFDSSQEECMRVVEQQERRDRKERKEKKEKKRTSSKRSAAASSDTSSDDKVLKITCKYCTKFSKSQHPTHITPDTCMWNKKVRKFRLTASAGR